jgi:hypothetical protein
MALNPNDDFERLLGTTAEAERAEKAVQPLYQFERGLLTVAELAAKLRRICDENPDPEVN